LDTNQSRVVFGLRAERINPLGVSSLKIAEFVELILPSKERGGEEEEERLSGSGKYTFFSYFFYPLEIRFLILKLEVQRPPLAELLLVYIPNTICSQVLIVWLVSFKFKFLFDREKNNW
jgi:hypothetical protein